MVSRNKLSRIESDWETRGLFRKRRRSTGKIWLILAVLLAIGIYYNRVQIPELLLDGFKTIAHLVPNQQDHPID